MKQFVFSALVLMLCGTAAGYAAYENSSVVGQVPDRIIIVLETDLFPTVDKAAGGIEVDVPSLNALAERFAVRDMAQLYRGARTPDKAGVPDLRLHWTVDFSAAHDLETVRAAYEALPEVSSAWAVDICKQYYLPNDPALADGDQWYLRNLILGQKDVRAVGGWAEETGDPNIIIAICDSGVDWQHPDLGGTGPDYIDGDIWINWTEWNGTPGVDDDGNSYIDDFRGWDFVDLPAGSGWPGEDVEDTDNDPSDFESHGTACAGIAAAITDNGIGIAGAAHDAKVMAVRCGWLPNGEDIGVVRMDFAAAAISYAAANGANLINCSWGSTSYLSFAVNYAHGEGALICTAAGNDNDEVASYLAGRTDILAVAATDDNDIKASFSSFGTWVELSAPGVGMYTTWYEHSGGTHTYASSQGTSFSSPLVAGCCGLIWSAHPGWTRTQVMNEVMATCDDIDAVNPAYAGKLGAGRANLLKALGDSFQEVPDEFDYLLDAMNESAPNDTVGILGSHALSGLQTIIGRDIYILGGYSAGYASRDPVNNPTVITTIATKAAMMFLSDATPATVVDGFRCTGGGGSLFTSSPYTGRYGGGVVVNNVSPTLRNLDVTGNSTGSHSDVGCGGGVYLRQSNSVLENCKIHGNTSIYGAGVMVYLGAPTLIDCEIYDNISITDNLSNAPDGGGLHVGDADLTLVNCRVSGHDELNAGGGIYAANYSGSTSLDLTDCEIYDNLAEASGGGIHIDGDGISMLRDNIHDNGYTAGATFMNGGGIYVVNADADLDSVTCQGNSAHSGGGITITGAATGNVTNSLIVDNTALIFGGGLSYSTVTSGSIAGNTVADNDGTASGAGGLYITSSSPSVNNNIVAFNTGGGSLSCGFYVGGGSPIFICNDAYSNDNGNYGGVADQTGVNGNVSVDPMFCDRPAGDYAIDDDSPCAPAHSGGCGLIGALATATCLTPVPGSDPTVPLVFRVEQNYPNPFNPLTKIVFALPEPAFITVRIYDLTGRLVRTLLADRLDAAVHEVTWAGRDDSGRNVAAGIYFYDVTSESRQHRGKMVLVK